MNGMGKVKFFDALERNTVENYIQRIIFPPCNNL